MKPHNTLAGFLQEELIKKVQRESNENWLKNLPPPKLLKVEKPPKPKPSAGLANFILQFRP